MAAVAAYLLDIEGTTTPVDFVTKTLFPYARKELSSFVDAHDLTVEMPLLSEEYARDTVLAHPPAWHGRPEKEGVIPYLEWLMDHDRKSTGLKSIQGRIWEDGYLSGKLKGSVYPDVTPAFHRWKGAGRKIAIFSSGSVLAQKLIFGHLDEPLSHLIDGYYDTNTGPKRNAQSYHIIAKDLSVAPESVLFLSDIGEEVTAALESGMQAIQVLRDGQQPTAPKAIRSFDELP